MEIEFNYYHEGQKVSSEKIILNHTNSIRVIFLETYKRAIKKHKFKNWYNNRDDNEIPFNFKLNNLNHDISSYEQDFSSIKYKLNMDGTIYLLKGYDKLYTDYSITELIKLKEIGVIKSDFNRIDFSSPVGLGAGFWVDDLKLFLDILLPIIKFGYKAYISQKERIELENTLNQLLEKLKINNNIENIIELRELFDDIDNWTTKKAKELLNISEELATFLLMAQGYELIENGWVHGTSKESRKREKIWNKQERKYEKFRENFYK
ncbi:hypothetical protein OKW23_001413 [Bacilli bacterium PM5-9]|nr:hypothetical protein [Bacilli bacterium PM5-9]